MKFDEKVLIAAYRGDGGFEDGSYLVSHPRESETKYAKRKALAVYPNYTKKVVNAYLGFIFAARANRTGGGKGWEAFEKDADGLGTGVGAVLRRHFRLSMVLGTMYLIVDRPRGKAVTSADEQALPPYIVARRKSQVHKIDTDDRGRYTKVAFTELKGKQVRYRWFDTNRWWVTDDREGESVITEDGERLEGEHKLGVVPVVPLHCEEPLEQTDTSADSFAKEIAKLNYELFNALSELRELFRSQTFSIFTLPFRDTTEAKDTELKLSTENAVAYNPEGGGKPGFVAPPDGPVERYMDYLDWLIDRIYQLAGLEFSGGSARQASSGASGVALSFQFQETNRSIAGMAQQIETAERAVADIVGRWHGEQDRPVIAYPRDFNVIDLLQQLQIVMDALTMQISDTFGRTLKKRLARSVLGSTTDQATLDQIDKEIDAGTDPYGDRIAKAAGAKA
ncbi:phage portal protein [Endothiovibrio diazotrophicus]